MILDADQFKTPEKKKNVQALNGTVEVKRVKNNFNVPKENSNITK